MTEYFNLSNGLDKCIVGQKRTGKHKQFVFIVGENVIKGPYKKEKIQNILFRSEVLKYWNTPYIVKAQDYFFTNDGVFIIYPNIMSNYNLEYENYHENFSGLNYNIIKNPPVVDIGSVIDSNNWIYTKAEELILAWCHLNILNVGDVNLRNALVDIKTKELYIIDYDENLGKDRDDEYFYFNKPPKKSTQWYKNVCYCYKNVADRLINMLSDKIVIENNLKNRVSRVINLLLKYNYIIRSCTKNPLPNIININTDINKINEIIFNNELPSSPNIGKMLWKGHRGGHSKTYSGIDFDVAKSALQKYIRRSIVDKALLVAVELYRFTELGSVSVSGVTNTFNRIAIIANEDIGPANLPLVLEVTKIIESGDRDLARLLTMVELLANSKKTRIMSHAWRAYAHPDGRNYSLSLNLPIDTEYTIEDINFIRNYNDSKSIFLDSDPDYLKNYVIIFFKRLTDQNFNAFSWVYFFLNNCNNIKLQNRKKFLNPKLRGNTSKPDILLWKAISNFIDPETHDILINAYYKHTENRPFLQNAIIIALYRVPYFKFDIEPYVNIWRHNSSLSNMLNGKYSLEIDHYVIDKHTSSGRANGANIKDFVEEGSIVIPQDLNFYVPVLEQIYKYRN